MYDFRDKRGYRRTKAKKYHFHVDQKVGGSNAIPIKLFSVDYYEPKTLSFKFGSAIFITFEMPRYPTRGPFGKSTFFCYSVNLLQRSLGSIL